MNNGEIIPNYISVFDKKVDDLKKKIKKELSKDKKDRNTLQLKQLIDDTKKLQRIIKEAKKQTVKQCPHCGKDLES